MALITRRVRKPYITSRKSLSPLEGSLEVLPKGAAPVGQAAEQLGVSGHQPRIEPTERHLQVPLVAPSASPWQRRVDLLIALWRSSCWRAAGRIPYGCPGNTPAETRSGPRGRNHRSKGRSTALNSVNDAATARTSAARPTELPQTQDPPGWMC